MGITNAKKRVKQELGITAAMNWGGFNEVEMASRLEISGKDERGRALQQ